MNKQSVAEALEHVRERIRQAGGDDSVRVLPVTKGFGRDTIEAVIAAGCTDIGENYANEVQAKHEYCAGLRVHFIGQLQTNKVRRVADLVTVYESLDRSSLAFEIARRAPGATVLIQVDTAGESGKGGCSLGDLNELVETATGLGLLVQGLMTVAPTAGGPNAARSGFRLLRSEVDRLGLTECSMGMSNDLEVAVGEGSTQVRVGTALFGERQSLLHPIT